MTSEAYGRPTRIAAQGSTVVMRYPGALHRVAVNFKGTAGNTLTLYDAATVASIAPGLIIGTIDMANIAAGGVPYGAQVKNGVVAVMAGGTPGDATVVTD